MASIGIKQLERKILEARGGIEPPIMVLQTIALPLGDRATGLNGFQLSVFSCQSEKKSTLMADVVLRAASEGIFDRPAVRCSRAGQATPQQNCATTTSGLWRP